jgi:hypothetical protein
MLQHAVPRNLRELIPAIRLESGKAMVRLPLLVDAPSHKVGKIPATRTSDGAAGA